MDEMVQRAHRMLPDCSAYPGDVININLVEITGYSLSTRPVYDLINTKFRIVFKKVLQGTVSHWQFDHMDVNEETKD